VKNNKILIATLLAICVIGFSTSFASATTSSVPISVQTGDIISVHGCVVEWNNRVIINDASLADRYSPNVASDSFYVQISRFPECFNVSNRINEDDGLNEVVATVIKSPFELNINIILQNYLFSITIPGIYNET